MLEIFLFLIIIHIMFSIDDRTFLLVYISRKGEMLEINI